jgi:hypothetical protein
MLHRLLMPMEPIVPFAAESAALVSVARSIRAADHHHPTAQWPGSGACLVEDCRVEPSRKRTVIS